MKKLIMKKLIKVVEKIMIWAEKELNNLGVDTSNTKWQ